MREAGTARIAAWAGLALFAGGMVVDGSAAKRPASAPIALVCSVSGLQKNRGALTQEAVCAHFSARIAQTLALPVAQAAQVPGGDRARWVRAVITLHPLGRAEAVLTSRLHGQMAAHPVVTVRVMDKPLDLSDIDNLARLAGKSLALRN